MDEAIEIVEAMYDEVLREYNKRPLYMMESVETATRINTIAHVLRALKLAREQK